MKAIMRYTPSQMRIIRTALMHFRQVGGLVPGHAQSWTQVVGELEAFTVYVFDYDTEATQLKNDAEALRQFANRGRAISDRLLERLIDLLSHRDIALLNRQDLTNDDYDTAFAIKLRTAFVGHYLAGQIEDDLGYISPTFSGLVKPDAKELLNSLSITPNDMSDIFGHLSIEFTKIQLDAIRLIDIVISVPYSVKNRGKAYRAILKWRVSGTISFISAQSGIAVVRTSRGKVRLFGANFRLSDLYTEVILHPLQEELVSDREITPLTFTKKDQEIFTIFAESKAKQLLNLEDLIIAQSNNGEYLTSDRQSDIHRIYENFNKDIELGEPYRHMAASDWLLMSMIQHGMKSEFELTSASATNHLVNDLSQQRLYDFFSWIEQGARFDSRDSAGKTSLHYLAMMGWRDGISIALKHSDRCSFALRDNAGKLASYYAMTEADDPALARLLMYLEAKSGAGLRSEHDRPRPLPTVPRV